MIASWPESYGKPRQCVEKQRDYSVDKGPIVMAMVFPVVKYSCESWTIKKAEWQRTDAFQLVVVEKTPKVPQTARRSNHSIVREINPEYLLEGLMLKMKLQ